MFVRNVALLQAKRSGWLAVVAGLFGGCRFGPVDREVEDTVLKRLILCVVILVVIAPAAVLAWAPHLPRLLWEGYPSETWPAPGTHVPVLGNGADDSAIVVDTGASAFDPDGRRLFEDNQGRALLIFHDGRLRFEHYADGIGPETRLNSYSLVKSLLGALVLKALAEGRIGSLKDPIGRYLPDLGDANFRAIPIDQFLRMTSGIAIEAKGKKAVGGEESKNFEGTRLNPFGPMARLHMGGLDRVAAKLTIETMPEAAFNYQNVSTAIIGRLVTALYHRPLEQVLSEKIWQPAGAGTAHWRAYGPGKPATPYCCLYATPRDWIKVAIFLSRNGTRDQPFLPQSLWRRFFGNDLTDNAVRRGAYGLHLYHDVLDRPGEPLQGRFAYMFGSRGQIVYMMPDHKLVVVRFGRRVQLLHSTLYAAWRSLAR